MMLQAVERKPAEKSKSAVEHRQTSSSNPQADFCFYPTDSAGGMSE
jgi:hypothetical protein